MLRLKTITFFKIIILLLVIHSCTPTSKITYLNDSQLTEWDVSPIPPKHHLEIGDIVNFTNFTVPKVYGTAVNDGSTNKFYIITDISKSITSADIECIQVGDVDV